MKAFEFWQRWLVGVSLVMAVFGLLLAFFSQSALFDFLFNNQINPVFWSSPSLPQDLVTFQGWIYAVLGATVTGWAIFLGFIAWYPFKQRQLWAWRCLALGLSTWFVLDTSLSIYFGVYFNAAFNTILFIAIMLPLLFCRKDFRQV